MGSGISRQIWKWYNELIAKSGLSCLLIILFRNVEQNYEIIVLLSVLDKSAAYQCRFSAYLDLSSRGLSTTLLASPTRDTNWAEERTLAGKGSGDSLISRNPPWLWPWTVPVSPLWVFSRYLALKNPPAVTLGTLEKTPSTFSTISPFLIEKAITSSIGQVKTIRKIHSGDFFLEVTSAKQSAALKNLRKMAHIDITVVPHNSLNYSRGVISTADLLNVSTDEIKENMQDPKVCDVRRITIRWDGQVLNTKHLILTFLTPELPQSVKATYLHCPVRPYISNQIRCFQCQRFGHSKTVCGGQPTCSRCAEVGHDSADCKAKERCVNFKGDHSSFSRSCPTWVLEKEITPVKIKNKLSYPEARRVVSSRTPVSGKSYASATSKTCISTAIQVDASTATTSAKAESIKPKTIAVDTRKTVSTPRYVKKQQQKNTHKGLRGASKQKQRSNLSKKPHDMGEDVIEIHASQSDGSLMEGLSPRPSSSSSLRGVSAKI
ncbi:uncharacterized protein TNCV_158401 [Trichonephila clavipes]|nr:uncharacterized protein TNCV_158401 [Trichonephila clavipes]